MMATAANTTAPGTPDGDKNNEATAALPPPPPPGSSWPRALRINVELAENYGRRTGAAAGLGRINEKDRPKTTFPTRRPSKQPRHAHREEYRLAERCGGADGKARKAGVAGPRVDVGLAGSSARAEGSPASATGGFGRLRELLENRRSAGVITRSTGRRPTARGSGRVASSVVIDSDDNNMAPGDGVLLLSLGDAGGGGAHNDNGNDATRGRSAAKGRLLDKVERYYWPVQGGAAMMAGGGTSAESREGQGSVERLRLSGVTEAGREKVDDDHTRTHLELLPPQSRHHHQLGPRIGIYHQEAQRHQRKLSRLVGPTTMDDVAALMSEALATVSMASAVTATAESAFITTADVNTPLTPPPARETAAAATPSKNTATAATRPQPQEHDSSWAFREANAAYVELRNFALKIDGRCEAAVKALHAAARAVARPGEELNQAYDAYRHACCSLRAAEVSVRDAEEQEDAAILELRRAGEVVEAAEGGVARAAKALRGFDAGCSNRRSHFPSTNDKVKDEQKMDGEDYDDHYCTQQGNEESRRTRESLRLALKTAGSNADRVTAELNRKRKEAIAAMTLVGARTAGEWSLAAEACDAARKRFQRAGLEALPKIKLFSEEARLFRNLKKLRGDTRQRLSAASQAREAARVAAAEAVAVTVARRMSSPVATAVAVKAAAEAAARAAAHSEEDAFKQEEKQAGEAEDEAEEEDGNEEEGQEEGTRQWVIPASPWVSSEEQGEKEEGGAEAARVFAATFDKEGQATKKARK